MSLVKRNNFTIKLDRDSVCMGDDMESHETIIELENDILLSDFINIHFKGYLPCISGGEATWIIKQDNFGKLNNLAVLAQQWASAKLLVDDCMISSIKLKKIVAAYECQIDPLYEYKRLNGVKSRLFRIIKKIMMVFNFYNKPHNL